jgi:sortase A
MMAGTLAIGYAGYTKAGELSYQRTEMAKFEAPKVTSSPQPRNDSPARPALGDVLGEIRIPRLGLKAIVVEGDSSEILRRAVGHVPNTALPGEFGNVGLAGHRDSLFRSLRRIKQGDLVTFELKDQQFRYQVQYLEIVEPGNIAVLQSGTAHELTLITCFPFTYIGPAPNRFIVHAHEVDASP